MLVGSEHTTSHRSLEKNNGHRHCLSCVTPRSLLCRSCEHAKFRARQLAPTEPEAQLKSSCDVMMLSRFLKTTCIVKLVSLRRNFLGEITTNIYHVLHMDGHIGQDKWQDFDQQRALCFRTQNSFRWGASWIGSDLGVLRALIFPTSI